MHFSENDLREALKRKDPGSDFRRRVMERIHGERAAPISPQLKEFNPRVRRPWNWRMSAVPAGALVAIVMLFACIAVVRYRQVQERRAGELAQRQAIFALRLTSAKLNHVFEHIRISSDESESGEK
jgi:hypothetical protein